MKPVYRTFLWALLGFFALGCGTARPSARSSEEFQKKLDTEYRDADQSPLYAADREKFVGHDYFPIDSRYVVLARLEYEAQPDTVIFPTSSEVTKKYITYARAHFTLDGQSCTLMTYRSLRLMEMEEYADYVFLPFRDASNNFSSYGGGRYLDLETSQKGKIWIDFNKAYNPYCAYSEEYNCPVVPIENKLPMEIKAGVRLDGGHYEYHKK